MRLVSVREQLITRNLSSRVVFTRAAPVQREPAGQMQTRTGRQAFDTQDDPLPFLIERKFGLVYGRILVYVVKDLLQRKPRCS